MELLEKKKSRGKHLHFLDIILLFIESLILTTK